MKTLLWKDYRVNRQVLIVGMCLLVAPFLAVLTHLWYSQGLIGTSANVWAAYLMMGARASLIASVLTIVILGGHVIAGERRDRSAEFLAYLPPSPSEILRSKMLLSVAVFAVIWGVYLGVAELLVPLLGAAEAAGQGRAGFSESLNMIVAVSVAMFGMAWLGSSMLESPTYSTSIGIAAAMVAPLILLACRSYTGSPESGEAFMSWLRILYFVFGGGGLLVGWMYYVRRVEP